MPADLGARLDHVLADATRASRDPFVPHRRRAGRNPLDDLLPRHLTYFDEMVAPFMSQWGNDCSAFSRDLKRWFSWAHSTQLWGLDDEPGVVLRNNQAEAASAGAMQHCLDGSPTPASRSPT